jgi:hypothetical protein
MHLVRHIKKKILAPHLQLLRAFDRQKRFDIFPCRFDILDSIRFFNNSRAFFSPKASSFFRRPVWIRRALRWARDAVVPLPTNQVKSYQSRPLTLVFYALAITAWILPANMDDRSNNRTENACDMHKYLYTFDEPLFRILTA